MAELEAIMLIDRAIMFIDTLGGFYDDEHIQIKNAKVVGGILSAANYESQYIDFIQKHFCEKDGIVLNVILTNTCPDCREELLLISLVPEGSTCWLPQWCCERKDAQGYTPINPNIDDYKYEDIADVFSGLKKKYPLESAGLDICANLLKDSIDYIEGLDQLLIDLDLLLSKDMHLRFSHIQAYGKTNKNRIQINEMFHVYSTDSTAQKCLKNLGFGVVLYHESLHLIRDLYPPQYLEEQGFHGEISLLGGIFAFSNKGQRLTQCTYWTKSLNAKELFGALETPHFVSYQLSIAVVLRKEPLNAQNIERYCFKLPSYLTDSCAKLRTTNRILFPIPSCGNV